MKRICVDCGIEKDLEMFVKGPRDLYRYKCKECKNAKRRTGLPNIGRFKTGEKSIGVTFKKGETPWYIKRGLPAPRTGMADLEREDRFDSAKYKIWKKEVLERDSNKCVKCSSTERLAAHHIKTWKDHPELRFEISNGMTLCNVCHSKEEGFQKGHVTILDDETRKRIAQANTGRKFSEEHKQKLSNAKLGKTPHNKGKSPSEEARRKMSEAKKGKPSNRLKNIN